MDALRGVSRGTAAVRERRPSTLPDGLASMAPGPELAVALATVDRAGVAAEDLPELVKARARLLAYEQAEFLLDLVEAAHGTCAEPGSIERYDDEELVDSAAVELGWALRWSQPWTGAQIDLGQGLRDRLPMVLEALRAGRIDRERAFAFVDALQFLDEPMAQAIAAKLLVKAENLTVGELRERLRYHIDRADPQAQRRRYRKGVAGRGVWLRGNDDGTADLAGVRLPPHRAAAAFDRVDRLARAARRDGDVRNLSQLRADAFTDLLSGTPFQLAPSTDPISAEADAAHPIDDPTLSPPGRPKRLRRRRAASSDDRLEANPPPNPEEADEPVDRIDLFDYDEYSLTDEDRWWLSRLGEATAAGPGQAANTDSRFTTGKIHESTTAAATLDGFARPPLPGDRCACGGLLLSRNPQGAHVQVKLTTLLGWEDHPALIPGLGPVVADIARYLAFDAHSGPAWRWSVFDDRGELLHHGYTTRRPTTVDQSQRSFRFETGKQVTDDGLSWSWCRCVHYDTGTRRGVVDVHLTMTTLQELLANPDRAPGYEALVADIARRALTDVVDNHATDTASGSSDLGLTRRFPDVAEAAFIRARDRSCRTPHCRKPAGACEIDHRIEHAKGGPSDRGNCHCLCKRHHGIRHRKGFVVTKRGRTTTWTTRNGRKYNVTPDKDIRLTEE